MPPSANRRPGHSRRAQFGIFTGYVIAALGAMIGAVLLGISLWQPGTFSSLRGVASDATTPVGRAVAGGRAEGQGLWETIAGYVNAGSKNARLEREVELARIQLEEARGLERENRQLKALLRLSRGEEEPVAVARLVGSSASSTRRFGYLGAGTTDGVAAGMPVRSERGVLGRVLEVGRHSSRVLLLTDAESVLPVRRAQDDVIAFAEGRGDGLLRIRLINLGINPIAVGDVFVTSGAGGIYASGIAVAIVNEVTSDGGIARMISDPAATDYVMVLPVHEPEAAEVSSGDADAPIEEVADPDPAPIP